MSAPPPLSVHFVVGCGDVKLSACARFNCRSFRGPRTGYRIPNDPNPAKFLGKKPENKCQRARGEKVIGIPCVFVWDSLQVNEAVSIAETNNAFETNMSVTAFMTKQVNRGSKDFRFHKDHSRVRHIEVCLSSLSTSCLKRKSIEVMEIPLYVFLLSGTSCSRCSASCRSHTFSSLVLRMFFASSALRSLSLFRCLRSASRFRRKRLARQLAVSEIAF